MSRTRGGRLILRGIRGRDGSTDSPLEILPDLCAEAMDVELGRSGVAQKRRGGTLVVTDTGNVFAAQFRALVPFIPGNDPTAAQLFGLDAAGTWGRLAAGTDWASITVKDAATANAGNWFANGVSFNGKLFLAYDSGVDRLHVWDGTSLRRVGLDTPAAPSAANTGSGSYAATARWYRVRYRRKSGSTVISESEASSATSFTPSGSGTHARVTKPSSISEGETHWVLEASSVGSSGPFYEVAETAVGTTTYDDNATVSSYASLTASQPAGTFTVPGAARMLLRTGENRFLMAGTFNASGLNNRVWFTASRGALRADDERIPQTTDLSYYIDLGENDGDSITALGGPLNGQPIVFKNRQIWRLIPTGDDDAPYEPRLITDAVGCMSNRTVVMGADERGKPALYFLSDQGPYRIGANGVEFMGADVQDIIDTFELSSIDDGFWALRYHARRQVWWTVLRANIGYVRLKFHERLGRSDGNGEVRGGWSIDSGGEVENGEAGVMFAATIGASMSRDLKPYLALDSQSGPLLRCDDAGVYSDNGTAYRSYIDTKPLCPAGDGVRVRTGTPMIIGVSTSGTPTIEVRQRKDYDTSSDRTASTTLSTTRAAVLVESGETGDDALSVTYRVGDAASTTVGWTIDRVIVPWEPLDEAVTV